MRLSRQLGKRQDAVYCVAGPAMVAADTGDDKQAGTLWGAVDALERDVVGGFSTSTARHTNHYRHMLGRPS